MQCGLASLWVQYGKVYCWCAVVMVWHELMCGAVFSIGMFPGYFGSDVLCGEVMLWSLGVTGSV